MIVCANGRNGEGRTPVRPRRHPSPHVKDLFSCGGCLRECKYDRAREGRTPVRPRRHPSPHVSGERPSRSAAKHSAVLPLHLSGCVEHGQKIFRSECRNSGIREIFYVSCNDGFRATGHRTYSLHGIFQIVT